jgi:hypothetical protein
LAVWNKIVRFTGTPLRAFAAPHALNDQRYKYVSARVEGLTLDRCRIASASNVNQAWLAGALGDDLRAWLKPRIERLLADRT